MNCQFGDVPGLIEVAGRPGGYPALGPRSRETIPTAMQFGYGRHESEGFPGNIG